MTQTKLEELKKQRKSQDWITIGYDQIPKEVFDRYGTKPFEIMKKKMRKPNGEVWANITFNEAKAEVQKLGYRLPTIQEMLVLLDWYKHEKGDKASYKDMDFLGIEELSYDEKVCYEWIDAPSACVRGAIWTYGSYDGAFTLRLYWDPGTAGAIVGFRCAR